MQGLRRLPTARAYAGAPRTSPTRAAATAPPPHRRRCDRRSGRVRLVHRQRRGAIDGARTPTCGHGPDPLHPERHSTSVPQRPFRSRFDVRVADRVRLTGVCARVCARLRLCLCVRACACRCAVVGRPTARAKLACAANRPSSRRPPPRPIRPSAAPRPPAHRPTPGLKRGTRGYTRGYTTVLGGTRRVHHTTCSEVDMDQRQGESCTAWGRRWEAV